MDYQLHDLHETESDEPTYNASDEDIDDLLARCHYTLTRANELRQPKWLRQELTVLMQDLDFIIRWTRVH